MIPDVILSRAKKILENESYSEEDGDKVVVVQKENNAYYAYVQSQKRGSFGQVIIDGNNSSFLYANSSVSPDELMARYQRDLRSVGAVRRGVRLPVIQDDEEIIRFAKQLTKDFYECHGMKKNSSDPLSEYFVDMLFNAIALLLSAKDGNTRLYQLTAVYRDVDMVRKYVATVKNRAVYDYWTKKVPLFMRKENSLFLVHAFELRVASLIGEQRIQDACRLYKARSLVKS